MKAKRSIPVWPFVLKGLCLLAILVIEINHIKLRRHYSEVNQITRHAYDRFYEIYDEFNIADKSNNLPLMQSLLVELHKAAEEGDSILATNK